MLGRRLVIDHGPNNSEKTILTYTNLSLPTIVKRLVQEGTVWPDRPWYGLPIVFPADVAGANSRTYYGYNYAYVADAIRDLTETDGGPDVDFEPSWAGEYLRLTLRAGSLGGSNWDYVLDAPDPGIYGLSRIEDADSTTTNAYSIGEGSEKNMLVRSHPNLDATMPALEKTESYKDISKVAELSALAQERIRAQSGPTVQISASIRKDGEPGPGGEFVAGLPTVDQLRFGDVITLTDTTDPWWQNGKTSHRLIEFSGSMSDPMVTLQFQPIGG